MTKNHLKRINAPKTWPINRKEHKFTTRPNAGGMIMELGLPVNLILKNMVNKSTTTKESRNLLKNHEVLVNGKKVWDFRKQVNFLDIISFPELNENYTLILTKKSRLALLPLDEKESSTRIVKIVNKTKIKKDRTQLNCLDGTNLIVKKDDYKTGQSLLIEIKTNKITGKLDLSQGSRVFLFKGRYIGNTGIIKNIRREDIEFEFENDDKNKGKVFKTRKDFSIALPEKMILGDKK
jgi:small subunit ribosomal protein S4e